MIKLKTIPDTFLNLHWLYFESSEGFKKVELFSKDNDLSAGEKALYSKLNSDKKLLKNLVIGSPEVLLECINQLSSLIHDIPELQFAGLPTMKILESKINTKNNLSKIERFQNKLDLLDKLVRIDSFCVRDKIYPVNKYKGTTPINTRLKISIDEIKKLFKLIKDELSIKGEEKDATTRLNEVFNYDLFTNSYTGWGAYALTKALNVSVCPYCNRNYIHTIETESGKTRAELDHYYPKSRFPFLALSIYNLVPSCHICNSSFKGSIDFYSKLHIHPYTDNFLNKFQFSLKIEDNSLGEPVPNIDRFEIEVIHNTPNEEEIKKITNSTQTFKFIELYNEHKDIAQEVLEKAHFYNETKLKELQIFFENKTSKPVKYSEIEINLNESTKKFILGNYTKDNELGKRSLAKFTRDIAMDTELKKYL